MIRRVVCASVLLLSGACARSDGPDQPVDPQADAGTDTPEDPAIFCRDKVPGAQDGTCDVSGPSSATRIAIRGDVLAPDKIYVDGTVVIEGDEITCVGCDC